MTTTTTKMKKKSCLKMMKRNASEKKLLYAEMFSCLERSVERLAASLSGTDLFFYRPALLGDALALCLCFYPIACNPFFPYLDFFYILFLVLLGIGDRVLFRIVLCPDLSPAYRDLSFPFLSQSRVVRGLVFSVCLQSVLFVFLFFVRWNTFHRSFDVQLC
eukprot:TRINITY_DN4534_c0_g1_i3.p1 TRINITY_DN4534_c0_g1~~TRINITY_DN4534_c0_g1_i3.p1  ORF type:complete len:161 (-),score=14.04 TRINITY_DN4534_c0_g1_i3:26-508(-)